MKKTSTHKLIERLDDWDWSTLVASWRYYENRMTIASSMFPSEIVDRFWHSGKYANDVLDKIAHQFAKVDHYSRGEGDWTGKCAGALHDCDKLAWCKLYAFCKAWCDGFKVLKVSNGKKAKKVEAFWCEYTKHWHPKDEYISSPFRNCWIPNEYIKSEVKECNV